MKTKYRVLNWFGKPVKLFWGSVAPGVSISNEEDVWYDTANHVWNGFNGSAWAAISISDNAVTTAKIAAGALAASAAGRGKIAANFFDEATVAAKFAADSFTAAVLLQLIKDGAFAADAATRALFGDGIWTGAKIASDTITTDKMKRSGKEEYYCDFIGPAAATLPAGLTTQDTSPAGSPTLAYGGGINGDYVLKLATTTEAEKITLYNGDAVWMDVTKGPVFEFRWKLEPDVTGAGGALGAGDIIVMGLASARNATLDSVVTNAWLRLEGANANILVETDDGTTDNDDNDTNQDWTANTWYWTRIDCSNKDSIKFYLSTDGATWTDVTPEAMNLSAATAGTGVQMFFELQKASAANKDHRLTIDYVYAYCTR